MVSLQKADRRKHPRYPLSTGVQFHHCASRHDFPARSVDISDTGVLMYVPMTAPVQAGQMVKLTMGAIKSPRFASMSETPVEGRIVRVERQGLLTAGNLMVGVEFARA
ncbi:MAG: PilZ domain-containing protein [Phycisphaerae bacterium]